MLAQQSYPLRQKPSTKPPVHDHAPVVGLCLRPNRRYITLPAPAASLPCFSPDSCPRLYYHHRTFAPVELPRFRRVPIIIDLELLTFVVCFIVCFAFVRLGIFARTTRTRERFRCDRDLRKPPIQAVRSVQLVSSALSSSSR